MVSAHPLWPDGTPVLIGQIFEATSYDDPSERVRTDVVEIYAPNLTSDLWAPGDTVILGDDGNEYLLAGDECVLVSEHAFCPMCCDTGYVLNDSHAGAGSKDPSKPVSFNISACYYPSCDTTVRPIATLGVGGMFTEVIRHPKNGTIMALTGFTKPDYR